MPAQRVLRSLLISAVAVALLALPSTAAAADCPGQELQPAAENMAQAEAATLCLVNAERTSRGLPALRVNAQLRTAALNHSNDMAAEGYFAHDSLDGRDFTDRIDATGYIPSRGRWHVGENIGWGTGELATPALMLAGWMNSPAHRDNLLDRDFREIGIGIAPAAPTPNAGPFPGATYTTDFGARPDRERLARTGKAKAKKKKARKRKRRSKRRRSKSRRIESRTRVIATIQGVESFR